MDTTDSSRSARRCHHGGVHAAPGGLVEGRKLPRRLQVSGGGPWFVASRGTLARVGAGDLSLADLEAVRRDLGDSVFVALPVARLLQQHLPAEDKWGTKRLRHYEKRRDRADPTAAALARGAQVAVLPDAGIVWVDGEKLFKAGEPVALPWTDPEVALQVVRPRTVRRAMRAAIGPRGPKRATTGGAS